MVRVLLLAYELQTTKLTTYRPRTNMANIRAHCRIFGEISGFKKFLFQDSSDAEGLKLYKFSK